MDFSLYPAVPGSKVPGTSEDAAESMRESAPTLRGMALDILRRDGPATADEVAAKLGKSVLTIRPRVCELAKLGKIEDTGLRGTNSSGRRAVIWQIKDSTT